MSTMAQSAIRQLEQQGRSKFTLEKIIERTLINCAGQSAETTESFMRGAVIEAYKLGIQDTKDQSQ